MIILGGWWTFGAEAAGAAAVTNGPQWVHPMQGQPKQILPPRTRPNPEVWVQFGDIRSSIRTEDTWEGEGS